MEARSNHIERGRNREMKRKMRCQAHCSVQCAFWQQVLHPDEGQSAGALETLIQGLQHVQTELLVSNRIEFKKPKEKCVGTPFHSCRCKSTSRPSLSQF